MLRNILILGVFAAMSASVPIIYQANPQLIQTLLGSPMTGKVAVEPQPDVTLASVPGKPAAPPSTGRKVVIAADERGHFISPFKVNGRQIEAMIDTGATLVAVNSSTARRVGLSLNPSDFSHEVNTANGTIKAAVVTIDRLQVGGITVNDVQAIVLDDKALRINLIGMSFLQRLAKYQVESGSLLLVQ
ncbi:TIGR02281 family clan AA aspartic protease [Mesorhizobium sp. ES1-1]|uniref:TIGR02281 family clan AA aspartic protease n=1 Tax=Mesorhizobium sp. ES1-1 TaxID=2876629 RepID=UPI001CC9D121|nr:TIGR02281 family clan AA aspartic protease [Mesorhizobium sp. ES1-1]MBZ9677439.1 TIGR02281 family clan AA aspartic protease [Mesorhizobium sp. ES1-1]